MKALFVQPDQLSTDTALFRGCVPRETWVLLAESIAEFTIVPFHKQRITFVLSAMRHFAEELRSIGFAVDYFPCCADLTGVFKSTGVAEIRMMASADWGASGRYQRWAEAAGITVETVDNDMFINTRLEQPITLTRGKATRMEVFYRKLRAATGLLMDGPDPVGSAWNLDKDNRNPPVKGLISPPVPRFAPDAVTRQVMADVNDHFPGAFGRLDAFHWPVTRQDAQSFYEDFLQWRFPLFGDYQDAMVSGNANLFHSLISAHINIGLLDPDTVCRQAEEHFRRGRVPLNAAEGFIRQILGWREFVRELYRVNMPGYDESNRLEADLPLPPLYWSGQTRMNCVAEAVAPVMNHGLNHHIQRLMVTGNFGLIAGVQPQALNEWYWLAYIDAWHWVVTPNVIGMATFADGGLMASKPYAGSANYINKMSNYCKHCPYDPKQMLGEKACPFNALYWDFLARNKGLLFRNPRMSLSYKNLDRKSRDELGDIRRKADATRIAASDGTL